MKHFHKNLFASLLVLMLAACTMPAIPASPTAPVEGVVPAEPNLAPEPTPLPVVVTFADPVLEAMVRGSIGKPKGDISLAEAQGVTRMDLSDDLRRAVSEESLIHDLSGLESFSNLETLDLSNHAISDISPLRGLTKLSALSLAGSPVADISPLSELTNLKVLILSGCQASDYSVLANLVGLEVLMLDGSTISDLTPLSELTSLRQLYLADAPWRIYRRWRTSTLTSNRRISSSHPLWRSSGFNLTITPTRLVSKVKPRISSSTMPTGAPLHLTGMWISSASPRTLMTSIRHPLVTMASTMPMFAKCTWMAKKWSTMSTTSPMAAITWTRHSARAWRR